MRASIRRSSTLASLTFGIWTCATPALADQCAWIQPKAAAKAAKILEGVADMVEWCEPCGTKPKQVRIQEVRVAAVDGNKLREVYVNGEAIDLAYVFVPSRNDERLYDNLSKLAGCESSGVSKTLRWPPETERPAADWSGIYGSGPVAWRLTRTQGPSYEMQLDLVARTNGNDRGVFTARGDLEDGKLVMGLPFAGCTFELRKAGKELKAQPKGEGCGALGQAVSGAFARNGD